MIGGTKFVTSHLLELHGGCSRKENEGNGRRKGLQDTERREGGLASASSIRKFVADQSE